ncbi:hypothetical protein MY11210_000381 [Beauveria gryllotalpidicola]
MRPQIALAPEYVTTQYTSWFRLTEPPSTGIAKAIYHPQHQSGVSSVRLALYAFPTWDNDTAATRPYAARSKRYCSKCLQTKP